MNWVKVLSNSELVSTEFISISFSPDSKYLAAQSASPDWTLLLWVWEKNKLLTSTKTCNPVGANAASVTQVTFSPQVRVRSVCLDLDFDFRTTL